MDYIDLEPLPMEKTAQIFWSVGMESPDHWRLVAHWMHGAWNVAAFKEDREAYHLLGLIAWDHAGVGRPSLSEVAR